VKTNLPTIEVICDRCELQYTKLRCEHRRSEKLKRPHFCSAKCLQQYRDEKIGKDGWKKIHSYLIIKDSIFVHFIVLAKNKCQQRKKDFDLDVKYLKKIWNNQKGICPYTGIKMELPKCGKDWDHTFTMEKMSLDRIDSSKGYIRGNVQFVCLGINYAKNKWSDAEMKTFIEKIRTQVPTSRPPEAPGSTGST
jgi:hypothetical protein